MTSTLQISRDGPVARVFLNRPDMRNAFNDSVIAELTWVFAGFAADASLRADVLPATIGPYRVKALGEQASRRYFTTAERFDAARAHGLGFVHEVVSADAFDAKVDELVAALVANGPAAGRACKKLVQDAADRPIDDALRGETAKRIADIRASAEGKEGVQAFLNKRDPAWR